MLEGPRQLKGGAAHSAAQVEGDAAKRRVAILTSCVGAGAGAGMHCCGVFFQNMHSPDSMGEFVWPLLLAGVSPPREVAMASRTLHSDLSLTLTVGPKGLQHKSCQSPETKIETLGRPLRAAAAAHLSGCSPVKSRSTSQCRSHSSASRDANWSASCRRRQGGGPAAGRHEQRHGEGPESQMRGTLGRRRGACQGRRCWQPEDQMLAVLVAAAAGDLLPLAVLSREACSG
jgi:hypothetical protein